MRIRHWCHQNQEVAVYHSLRKEYSVRQPLLWDCWTKHAWFFLSLSMISHPNSLWPPNIRTILKLFPRLEKQPGFFMLGYDLVAVQLLVVETSFFLIRRLTYKWKTIRSSTRLRSTSSGYSFSTVQWFQNFTNTPNPYIILQAFEVLSNPIFAQYNRKQKWVTSFKWLLSNPRNGSVKP